MLRAAQDYALIGWPIFPVDRGTKKPLIPRWQKAGVPPPAQVQRWFGGVRPPNIGCLTGPLLGAWVLDVDVKDGQPGLESLAKLEERLGPIPRDIVSRTGSGGYHIFLKWNQSLKTTANRMEGLEGLDIRAVGGQVVLPPSIHENGQIYQWINGYELG